MGIKYFNHVALPDFTNVITLNELNSDIKTSHLMLENVHPPFYSRSFHIVSLWERVFLDPRASHDIVILRFDNNVS